MKLHFLGTGAADWPNPGKKVGEGRRMSSMVVNDSLMIDCGTMTMDAVDEFNVDVNKLRNVIISHPHGDHFNMNELCAIAARRDNALPPLSIYVNKKAIERSPIPSELANRMTLIGFEPGDVFQCDNVKVTTLTANHELEHPGELAAHFYLEFPEGKTMFYALDGAWFVPDTWRFLQKHRMDFIVWELTCGNLADWRLWAHCNLGMVKLMTDAFRLDGSIHDKTVMFCSHLARTLCPPADLYARELKTNGYILANDGLVWEG